MDYKWIFDGIGSSLVTLILGLVIGAVGGYKKGLSSKQQQSAGDEARQKQSFKDDSSKSCKKIEQSQKAGDNAIQIQEVDSDGTDK